MGRKATIDRQDLFDATLRLIRPGKSISALSLREITREANISPNSFYRHFQDTDELAVALIEQSGETLRSIIREARLQAISSRSIIRSSVEIFVQQLHSDQGHLSLLLRESYIGSQHYKQAVEKQLDFFVQELQEDLNQLEQLEKQQSLQHAHLVAIAITQLVFHMGAKILNNPEQETQLTEDTIKMIRMLLEGARLVREFSD